MIKFVANNNELAFIKLFPFFIPKDMHLYIIFNIIDIFNKNTYK